MRQRDCCHPDIADQSFGADMGVVRGVPAGRELMHGPGTQSHKVVNDLKNGGLAAGTNLYFNKSRLWALGCSRLPLDYGCRRMKLRCCSLAESIQIKCMEHEFVDAYFERCSI